MAIIEWWIVPLILAYFIIHVVFLHPPEHTPPLVQASAKSGKFAGFVVLALFIISRKTSNDLTFSFTTPSYDFDYLSTVLAAFVGFGVLHLARNCENTKYLGIMSFVLTTVLAITIYSYFYITDVRSKVVFWTLGITLGLLLRRMLFPELEPSFEGAPQGEGKVASPKDSQGTPAG